MSNDYPTYDPQMSYPNPDAAPVFVPAPQQKRRGRPLLIIVVVLLVVAVGLGVLRYFGPVLVTQNFLNDVYSDKPADALNLVCPAEQAQAQSQLDAVGLISMLGVTIDTSHLSFNIQSEGLSSAVVAITGSISAYGITSSNINENVTLQASGLWWCINTNASGGSGGSSL